MVGCHVNTLRNLELRDLFVPRRIGKMRVYSDDDIALIRETLIKQHNLIETTVKPDDSPSMPS